MRTTVTLDEDVAELLRAAAERDRTSFKQVLNDAVRRGFRGAGRGPKEPFVIKGKAMELRTGIDPAGLRDVDDELEIEEFQKKHQALERATE
jgi:hypothetical protein